MASGFSRHALRRHSCGPFRGGWVALLLGAWWGISVADGPCGCTVSVLTLGAADALKRAADQDVRRLAYAAIRYIRKPSPRGARIPYALSAISRGRVSDWPLASLRLDPGFRPVDLF